jgi:hypothetical protein
MYFYFLYYRTEVQYPENILVLNPLVDPLLEISMIFGKILADENLFFFLHYRDSIWVRKGET